MLNRTSRGTFDTLQASENLLCKPSTSPSSSSIDLLEIWAARILSASALEEVFQG